MPIVGRNADHHKLRVETGDHDGRSQRRHLVLQRGGNMIVERDRHEARSYIRFRTLESPVCARTAKPSETLEK
jgi:hypothetical protein